jgi:peroxiredoxin
MEEMTQAQHAGGVWGTPQSRPVKGQLIRDFTLNSTLGQPISLSDYRGRSNLVLIFCGDGSIPSYFTILKQMEMDYSTFQDEQTQMLAIVQCRPRAATRIQQQLQLSFPLLVDLDGRIHHSAGAVDRQGRPAAAIYIADQFGEVFAAYRAADGEAMPSVQAIVKLIRFINSQCPECGHPEWPTESSMPR